MRTAKKDRKVKLALDARSLNNAILKDKFQMPNLENLMENVAQIGRVTTGTYAFKTGYYVVTTKPPELQKIMDKILHKTKNTFSFIDDMLVAKRRSHSECGRDNPTHGRR